MADQAVALITAGASGIGLTCARALSAEGHAVLTMDIDATAVAAFQAEFGEQTAVVCDVSDAEQVVAAEAAKQDVLAGAAVNVVIAVVAEQQILTATAVDVVGAVITRDIVIAVQAEQHLVCSRTLDNVCINWCRHVSAP